MREKNFLTLNIIFFSLFLLCSCGFEVIYKNHESPTSLAYTLASIKIEKKRSQLDWELQNSLYNLLNPDKINIPAKYLLTLTTTTTIGSTYITNTGASGRNRITINVNYTLTNLEKNQTISSGSTIASDNYDVSINRFGTFVAEEYVRNNILKMISNNLRNALVNDFVLLFKKNPINKTL
jgi:hypothetical protein